jgi:VanZ family protein
MRRLFSPESPYRVQAGILAVVWTIVILIGCFLPAKEIPEVDVPLIDKWTHIVLFSGFTFFWFCAYPFATLRSSLVLLMVAVLFGALIEIMQGILTFLGRSMELMDAVADSIGGAVGILFFRAGSYLSNRSRKSP